MDTQSGQGGLEPRITQDLHFLLPLGEVHRVQIFPVTRVATEFCDSRRQLRQQSDQRFHRNPFRVGTTFGGLAVKPATVSDISSAIPKRNPELARRFQGRCQYWLVPMHMLVRIYVAGVAADQSAKHSELA